MLPLAPYMAADPSFKEARDVLSEGAAYDYWRKSYETPVIERYIHRCLEELGHDQSVVSTEAYASN